MNRWDFQQLAEMRLREAEILFAANEYAGAYYLAGYALEFGLKACIAKLTQEFDYPDKKKTIDAWCHVLETLVNVAELKAAHQVAMTDPQFKIFWTIAKDWTENSRYDKTITKKQAEDLLIAIQDPAQGILQWVKANW